MKSKNVFSVITFTVLSLFVMSCVSTGESSSKTSKPKSYGTEKAVEIVLSRLDEAKKLSETNTVAAIAKLYECIFACGEDSLLVEIPFEPISELEKSYFEAKQLIEDLWKKIALSTVSVPVAVEMGKEFASDFSFKLKIDGTEISNVAIKIEQSNIDNTQLVKTNEKGVVKAVAPSTEVPGIYDFLVCVDARDLLVTKNIDVEEGAILLFERDAKEKGLSVPCRVFVSQASRKIPTSVAILDFNDDGPNTKTNPTSTALVGIMMRRGYAPLGISQFDKALSSDNVDSVVEEARELFQGYISRFLYGTTKIVSIEQNEKKWTATVEGSMVIYDFKEDKETARFTCQTSEISNSSSAAITAARRKLGETVVADRLYYVQ